MAKLWSRDGIKLEHAGNPPRCPRCCVPALMSSKVLAPGGLCVCAGCATPQRLSDDGRRFSLVNIDDLEPSDQERARRAIAHVLSHLKTHGLPSGLAWGNGAICRPCWDEFEPGREPCALMTKPWGTCEFCGTRTDAGIYRRMLVEKPESGSPGAPS